MLAMRFFVVPADTDDGDTASITRRFNLPAGVNNPFGMDIVGNDLYIGEATGADISIIPANTANGATATITREFGLPPTITTLRGMTLNGNNLCLVDTNDVTLYIVPADTPNGTQLTNNDIVRQFPLPSGLTFPNSLAFGQRFWTFTDSLAYQNHLNFSFDVLDNGTVYFTHAHGTSTHSSLIIKQRTSGGTETTAFSDNKGLTELTDLDAAGGTYQGVHECLFHNNQLYMLALIGRIDVDDSTDPPTYRRSRSKAAGMILYRCNVTDATPTLTVLSKWEFATHGACNLTVHDGAVHYVEQPLASQIFKPINPDL